MSNQYGWARFARSSPVHLKLIGKLQLNLLRVGSMRLLFDVCMVHTKVFKSLTLVVHMSHWMLLDTVLVWKDGPGR